ncbi:hypothetical protein chiPu_0030166, partial [Chiloscyllium punctatum]|nr:hypothetical protein [Chiloscyllium punctatum]
MHPFADLTLPRLLLLSGRRLHQVTLGIFHLPRVALATESDVGFCFLRLERSRRPALSEGKDKGGRVSMVFGESGEGGGACCPYRSAEEQGRAGGNPGK